MTASESSQWHTISALIEAQQRGLDGRYTLHVPPTLTQILINLSCYNIFAAITIVCKSSHDNAIASEYLQPLGLYFC